MKLSCSISGILTLVILAIILCVLVCKQLIRDRGSIFPTRMSNHSESTYQTVLQRSESSVATNTNSLYWPGFFDDAHENIPLAVIPPVPVETIYENTPIYDIPRNNEPISGTAGSRRAILQQQHISSTTINNINYRNTVA